MKTVSSKSIEIVVKGSLLLLEPIFMALLLEYLINFFNSFAIISYPTEFPTVAPIIEARALFLSTFSFWASKSLSISGSVRSLSGSFLFFQ
jgi:hypothetical protein